ncbi:MAG: DUF58 domain-containing protein [Fidelibacterota bacterium]
MIPREILQKVRQIEIRTKGLVNDVFGGEYHSVFKGRGMTFSEVREYQPGDDIRLIDWNVTARYGSPYVKIFEEERELTVILVIDVSPSGFFGTRNQLKIDLGTELAAVLGFSAIKNNDKVGAILFSDAVESYIPPKKGKTHILRLVRELLYYKPQGTGTSISTALELVHRVAHRRSVVFLISDFLDDGFWPTLKIVNKKHDLIGIHISDSGERWLPDLGLIHVHDPETGERVWLDTGSRQDREAFTEYQEKRLEALRKRARKHQFDFITLSTVDDYVEPLMNYFRQRERRH